MDIGYELARAILTSMCIGGLALFILLIYFCVGVSSTISEMEREENIRLLGK